MLFWKLFLQSTVFIFACVAIGEVVSGLLRKKKKEMTEGGEI